MRLLSDRYRLLHPIGEGGMSVVWRAHDELLGRPVAVKVLASRYAADPRSRAGIQVEARAAARLSHRHVASVYDYGESVFDNGERLPYLVIELLSGRSLADVLAMGALDPGTALRVCAEVAEGLAAAHEQGVVHRDVKPANVMLTPTGAKVFDFGIAAVVGQADEADANGRIMGTPSYLAPERLTGGPVVPATDVYALALLMFRLLTGEQPRAADDAYSQPAPLPPIPGVPPEIIELYRRSILKDPRRRPTASEAAAILWSAALPLGASAPDAVATESTVTGSVVTGSVVTAARAAVVVAGAAATGGLMAGTGAAGGAGGLAGAGATGGPVTGARATWGPVAGAGAGVEPFGAFAKVVGRAAPVEPKPPQSHPTGRPPAVAAACLAAVTALTMAVVNGPANSGSTTQPPRPVETLGQRAATP